MTNLRFSKLLGTVAALLAATVLMAACATNTGSADSSTSSQPDPVTTVVPTTTTQPGPVTTLAAATTTQPTPTTTLDATTGVTVVQGEPYRQPSDGDPSTVDIYLADTSAGSPTVVLLHGWGRIPSEGPDLDLGPLAEEIARLGSTVFYFGWDTYGGFSADSASDLSCIGGFVTARAAEYGSDPNTIVVIGHSM